MSEPFDAPTRAPAGQPASEPFDPQPRRAAYKLPLSRPIVTWALLAIIGVMFVVQTLLGGSTDTEVLILMGAKVTPLVAAGEYWRLFTSMFLHIGVMHLAFNGYALFVLGTELERLYGSGRFLAIYLLSGLFGSLFSYAFSVSLSAGASGAIFGLVGALAAFFMLHRKLLGDYGRRRLINIGIIVALNLFWGLSQPGIDNWAHMGGLLGGLGLGWALAPRYKLDPVTVQVLDTNRMGRYWLALALAVAILVGGTGLATRIHRDSPHGHLLRGQQAIEAEAWDEAAFELQQALDKDPSLGDATTYFYLGLAHSYLEEPQPAAQAYEAALAQDANHTSSLWNLAITYLDLGRYAEARDHFERYVEIYPAGLVETKPYLDELTRLGY
jgi:rhomboid protease GluP